MAAFRSGMVRAAAQTRFELGEGLFDRVEARSSTGGSTSCAVAMMAAAAYARAFDGILYEGEAGIVVGGEDVGAFAQTCVADLSAALVRDGDA